MQLLLTRGLISPSEFFRLVIHVKTFNLSVFVVFFSLVTTPSLWINLFLSELTLTVNLVCHKMQCNSVKLRIMPSSRTKFSLTILR
jgi:hypothetical protein